MFKVHLLRKMGIGKKSRMDGKRSSKTYYSTAALTLFITACLFGLWMITSSVVVPDNMSTSDSESNLENRKEFFQSEKQAEDSDDDVPSFEDNDKKAQKFMESLKIPPISGENSSVDQENVESEIPEKQKIVDDKNHDTETSDLKESEKIVEAFDQTQTEEQTSLKSTKEQNSSGDFPDVSQSELLNETNTQSGSWSTQASESKKEKEILKPSNKITEHSWKLCNSSAGIDYIPCLDNTYAINSLKTTKHYEHRERHCPEEGPICLVPIPDGYKQSVKWPNSRDKIWYANVPHKSLAEVKGHQNWVKVTGEYLTFPGGGTQFKNGALHYIDFIQESLPDVAWGKQTRVILDVGCGVASFGGFLFDRDVLTMSFAPKDEHEAQVQFALERGIPAISAVMGTMRLPFPGRVFDAVHCARCRVPWHIEGGMLLLELNRLLRPGGYFIWSATPIYQDLPVDVEIWKAMSQLTKSICWDMISMTKDPVNGIGVAIYRKPQTNDCYDKRIENDPPLCQESDDPNAAWKVPLQACLHRVPVESTERGSQWPEKWPARLETTPYWLNSSQVGIYGKPAPQDFEADYEHWKHVVNKTYLNGLGMDWSTVRNVMDMRSVYGGFAAAMRDMNMWVLNVVSINSPDTLPIIYERGLFGIYHNWCESFSSYPRTYDLLHADHLFSNVKHRCKTLSVMSEVDRLLRPKGSFIVRDTIYMIREVEIMATSMHWKVQLSYSKGEEGLLCVQKSMWRPQEVDDAMM